MYISERIESIAERFGLDGEQTLDNIVVCRVFSHEEQMEIVKPIAALLADAEQGTLSVHWSITQPHTQPSHTSAQQHSTPYIQPCTISAPSFADLLSSSLSSPLSSPLF